MLPSLLALALAVLIYRVPDFTYAFNGVVNIPLTIFIKHPNGETWHYGFNAIPRLLFVVMTGCFSFLQNSGRRTEADDGMVQ